MIVKLLTIRSVSDTPEGYISNTGSTSFVNYLTKHGGTFVKKRTFVREHMSTLEFFLFET